MRPSGTPSHGSWMVLSSIRIVLKPSAEIPIHNCPQRTQVPAPRRVTYRPPYWVLEGGFLLFAGGVEVTERQARTGSAFSQEAERRGICYSPDCQRETPYIIGTISRVFCCRRPHQRHLVCYPGAHSGGFRNYCVNVRESFAGAERLRTWR